MQTLEPVATIRLITRMLSTGGKGGTTPGMAFFKSFPKSFACKFAVPIWLWPGFLPSVAPQIRYKVDDIMEEEGGQTE